MQNNRPTQRGFSLIEFLTVFAVITLLASVALPAMQRARRDARSTMCRNNLKQFGLAMHNYHDTHRVFPPAWTNHHPHAGPETRFGWSVFVLPYMDRAPLYNKLDFSQQNPPVNALFQTKLPTYRCPSDTTPDINPLRGEYGASNYSGNFGTTAPPRWLPGRLNSGWPGQADTLTKTDGIMCLNSRVGLRDIVDGTSNTLMIGERSLTSGAGIWVGVGGNEFENDQVTDCSPGNEINSGFAAFSSRHGGGAFFALSDGAVRFISEKIESRAGANDQLGTYQKLSQRNDGQVVGEF